ncbi:MAG: RecX family transcriptional regulator [Gracilibacteraceae bacterium]|nr:RecX family transcriptional regulator [Gracilibacteraceae bacterium]
MTKTDRGADGKAPSGKAQGSPLAAALRCLTRRAYTARELMDKLRERGFSEEEAAAAVAQVLEWRYIDDEDYARRYCRLWRERRSRRRIQNEIRRRGVDEDIITAALAAEYPPGQETVNCRRAMLKKDRAAAVKTAAALYRQGYSERNIRRALAERGEGCQN